MIDQNFLLFIISIMALLTVLVITFAIPIFGFIIKRWKGLVLGCLLQPIICAIAIAATIFVINYYSIRKYNKTREMAMVTLRETATKDNIQTWYVKADDECLYEYGNPGNNISIVNGDNMTLYDVVPLDSFRVCIDDRVIISFDLEKRQVTAADYETPLEVVSIDWDKVNAYFAKR